MRDDLDVNPAAQERGERYSPSPVLRAEHAEGTFTRLIEHQVVKLPSNAFLFASLGCMGASLVCELKGKSRLCRLFEMAAPSMLILGLYNKLIKIAGSR